MRKIIIPHNSLSIAKEEKNATLKVLKSGWLTSADQVELLENEICKFFSLPKGHAIVVSSGSAALYLALWILKASKKKVGIPVYSCCSLRNAAHLIGAKPVYLDSSTENPNINIRNIKKNELDILIAPSIYGIPVELKSYMPFKVVEDISQAFGATVNGKKIGLRGDVGVCSFAATKLITTGGQGGLIISKKKSIIDKLKDFRDFDNRDDKKIRFNFLMTNIQAAIGREQLKKISIFKKKREEIFKIYVNAGLKMLDTNKNYFDPIRHRAILINPNPNKVIANLKKFGISSIIPLRNRELLDNKKKYKNAHIFSKSFIALPIYPNLSKKSVHKISEICLKC